MVIDLLDKRYTNLWQRVVGVGSGGCLYVVSYLICGSMGGGFR